MLPPYRVRIQVCSKKRIIAGTTAPIKAETQKTAAEMPKYTSTSKPANSNIWAFNSLVGRQASRKRISLPMAAAGKQAQADPMRKPNKTNRFYKPNKP
ncbi:MAG: hypothetical protein HOD73_05400 [Rhodobacteraceae bacterium]|nr:hypothetical protein [Paracoccaceae bacterium]